jgi:hypothetical protein
MARLSRFLVVVSGIVFLASCGKSEVPASNPVRQGAESSRSEPAAPTVPTAAKSPAPTDIACTGTYGTAPNLLVFFQNGTCWFTTSHGPDECSFTMDNMRVRISVSGNSSSGAFEDDCSKVHFGGWHWERSGEAQDPVETK